MPVQSFDLFNEVYFNIYSLRLWLVLFIISWYTDILKMCIHTTFRKPWCAASHWVPRSRQHGVNPPRSLHCVLGGASTCLLVLQHIWFPMGPIRRWAKNIWCKMASSSFSLFQIQAQNKNKIKMKKNQKDALVPLKE